MRPELSKAVILQLIASLMLPFGLIILIMILDFILDSLKTYLPVLRGFIYLYSY